MMATCIDHEHFSLQHEEKIEMTDPGAAGADKYGKDAGYSENYGAPVETGFQEQQQQQLEACDSYGSMETSNGDGSGAVVNPFTQRPYQMSTTNPFAR